jgi:hypothetical protein
MPGGGKLRRRGAADMKRPGAVKNKGASGAGDNEAAAASGGMLQLGMR